LNVTYTEEALIKVARRFAAYQQKGFDMTRASVFLGIAALALSVGHVLAQAPTNFTGKWTVIATPNSNAVLGQEATIAQDAKTLTVTRTTQAGEIRSAYNLDGSESKNTVPARNISMELVSKVKWDAGKLVITTTSNFNGSSRETSQTWSIDSTGNLVIEQAASEVLIGYSTIAKYKKL
jgi:hypothetical protein